MISILIFKIYVQIFPLDNENSIAQKNSVNNDKSSKYRFKYKIFKTCYTQCDLKITELSI